MKRTMILCGVAVGLTWGIEAKAQPINFGGKKASNQKSMRPIDKEEYAENMKSRWELLKKGFGERTREKDPFGSEMDPGIPKIVVTIPDTIIEQIIITKPIKTVTLKSALSKFVPTLISASQQVVMVGSRTMHVGDAVEIEYDGVLFKLRITKISSGKVEFINTENGEKETVREYEFEPGKNESTDDLFDIIKEDKKAPLLIK